MMATNNVKTTVLARDSSKELLRIVAMIFVVLHHANFPALGVPTQAEFEAIPIWISFRTLCESMTLVCVNVFVLISGWYGIKFKKKGVASLIFTTLFYLYVISAMLFIYSKLFEVEVNWLYHKVWFLPVMGGTNWYVLQYLILYVCSPMLNKYLDSTNKKTLGHFILFMLILNIYVGFVWHNGPFSNGYNFILMATLYLVARYMNLYMKVRIEKKAIGFYIISYLFLSVLYAGFILAWHVLGGNEWPFIYAYNNPLIILSSICLFCTFLKIKFCSAFVNRISKTTLAVLLIHVHPVLQQYFYSFVVSISRGTHFNFVLLVGLLVFFIFVVSYVLDELRQTCFEKISHNNKWFNLNK